jgi:hypothetical protein
MRMMSAFLQKVTKHCVGLAVLCFSVDFEFANRKIQEQLEQEGGVVSNSVVAHQLLVQAMGLINWPTS